MTGPKKKKKLTGCTPGNAASIVDMWVFIKSLYEVEESNQKIKTQIHVSFFLVFFLPENSLVFVFNWAWTSIPMTASQPFLIVPLVVLINLLVL